MNPWESVRGVHTMESIQAIPRELSKIRSALEKANDLKMVELGLMQMSDFKKKYSMEEEK